MLIDSHAHLDFPQLVDDLEGVLRRAHAAGVAQIVTVGTQLSSSRRALELAGEHRGRLFATAGVHPHEAGRFDDGDWPELAELWRRDDIYAVGETGLDYYYDFSPRDRQRQLFARHLEAAAEHELPVIIHVRDAFDDAFALLESHPLPAGGVLHCFTGGVRERERALRLGLHISLAGIATFRNADSLREAARGVPADGLLVETDAPYLAPVPMRGKRNEPAYVVHTARKLAEVRDEPLSELCARTRANAIRLFRLPLDPDGTPDSGPGRPAATSQEKQ